MTVNGQPSMRHWAAYVRHRAKNCDPTCYGHPRLQNSKDLGTFEHHRAKSIAAVSHEEKFLPRQKCVIMLFQQCFGFRMRTRFCPCGCQAIGLNKLPAMIWMRSAR